MARKGIAVVVAVLLIFSLLPGSVLGAGTSLELSKSNAAAGDSVTASGNAGPAEPVCIKVVDSSGNIVAFDIIRSDDSGYYSCSFIIPQGSPGTLTVTAGCGNKVESKTLTCISTSSPIPGSSIGIEIEELLELEEIIRSQIISNRGGIIKIVGAMLDFPLATVNEDIKVSIKKLRKSSIPDLPAEFELGGEVYEITLDKEVAFAKPVTITLYFDQQEIDSDKYDLGIYWWDEENNQWAPLEQVKVNLADGRVSGAVDHFSIFAILLSEKGEMAELPSGAIIALLDCNDIVGHWAEQSIRQLAGAGAVSGYPDGTFKPNNTITRAEFTAILVKALGLVSDNGPIFKDTVGHWAQASITAAATQGIVSGYNETNFGPDEFITREQMAVAISTAAHLSGGEGKVYADSGQIAGWAQDSVFAASARSIISGYPDNTFRPQANATRAEAATVIVKALAEKYRG